MAGFRALIWSVFLGLMAMLLGRSILPYSAYVLVAAVIAVFAFIVLRDRVTNRIAFAFKSVISVGLFCLAETAIRLPTTRTKVFRLACALALGVFLTASTVGSGFLLAERFDWVADLLPGIETVGTDCFDTGWTIDDDGKVTRFVESCVDGSSPRAFIRAHQLDGPLQWVTYVDFRAGAPFRCVELFWSMGAGINGSHRRIRPEDTLERFPSFMLKKVIWCGLLANIVIFTAIGYGMLLVPSYVRTIGRKINGHCLQCGYDLTGNESGVCSECGTGIETP